MNTDKWPPLKIALWRVLMEEQLNDGHYIKAFELIEKLHDAAASVCRPVIRVKMGRRVI